MPSALLSSPGFIAAGHFQTGDHLSRNEFLRIWNKLPKLKRAELIRGVVYLMSSPVSIEHGDMENNIGSWINWYRTATPGCASGNNATALLLDDSCPQPDVNLRIIPEFGGMSRVRKKLIFGAAELFAEVSSTSASMDLHQKYDIYREAGVPEYVVVVLNSKQIRWHFLVKKQYQLIPADSAGVYRSQKFPGLWLDSKALFANDMAKVMATLQKGIDSDEHQHFVEELAKRKRASKK